ncbi:MAG: sigma-70 family RNA polymerase sigma factor [Planctomycetota bacterium]
MSEDVPGPEDDSAPRERLAQREDLSALLQRARATARRAADHGVPAQDRSDLAQSVVRELARAAGRLEFRGVEAFDALVRTMFAHKMRSKLSRARAKRRDVRREVGGADAGDDTAIELPDRDPEHDPVQQTLAEELRSRLQKSIDGLPPRNRDVILLRAAGCSNAEVAAKLGLTEANAQKIYARTRAGLELGLVGLDAD